MKLIILGSGTILTQHARNCSGYLIDDRLLFDCGPGIWRALGMAATDPAEIDHICLTHFHVDHVSDLQAILMTRWLTGLKKVPLAIVGPQNLPEWFGYLKKLHGPWIDDLNLKLYPADRSIRINDRLEIVPVNTEHTEYSQGYLLKSDGESSLFYSGDMDFNTKLIDKVRGTTVGLLEASNTEETKIEGHLTPRLAGRFAQRAGFQKLILIHQYPEVLEIDAVEEAAAEFEGTIITAEDGMTIEI